MVQQHSGINFGWWESTFRMKHNANHELRTLDSFCGITLLQKLLQLGSRKVSIDVVCATEYAEPRGEHHITKRAQHESVDISKLVPTGCVDSSIILNLQKCQTRCKWRGGFA